MKLTQQKAENYSIECNSIFAEAVSYNEAAYEETLLITGDPGEGKGSTCVGHIII